jgi:hypothetical protein
MLTDLFEEGRRTGEIGCVDPRTIAVLFHNMLTYEIHQQALCLGQWRNPNGPSWPTKCALRSMSC